MTAAQAVRRVLAHSGLTAESVNDGGFIIHSGAAASTAQKNRASPEGGEQKGGVIDLIPMSAFDHKGLYKYLDAYGIWSSKRGAWAPRARFPTRLAGTMSSASCCPCATRSAQHDQELAGL
ncbi:STN domain-containing protein [Komagataeibacter xylinus]|uniref:STN domain-containing protein n=1 Tax=Komagataeibacter xylinus TaxID=28448 RepID=UPI001F10AA14|nr:STN domain-containing protein [Komagataeibacter xylinus]